MWRYKDGIWTWISGSNKASDPGNYETNAENYPHSRARATCFNYKESLWLFGGNVGVVTANLQPSPNFASMNDLWKFDLNTSSWTWMAGTSTPNDYGNKGEKGVYKPTNVPSARCSSAVAVDPATDTVWIFGGLGWMENGQQGIDVKTWRHSCLGNVSLQI